MIAEQKVHLNGFVRFLEKMGSDQTIEESARISYGEGTRKKSVTRSLIRYLMRHSHTSPFEMAEVRFHLKLPIFVMRQLVRHRTANLNEYSGRYSVMSDEFYLPSHSYVKQQSKTNKQGRGGDYSESTIIEIQKSHLEINDLSLKTYKHLIDELDYSRELARTLLPVSNYTEVIWKCDLHNFLRFAKLRMDSHAQAEIQDYAKVMYEMVKSEFPITCEAFEDYELGALKFTKPELVALKNMLSLKENYKETLFKFNDEVLSGREKNELLDKIELLLETC